MRTLHIWLSCASCGVRRRSRGTAFSFNGGKDSTVLLQLIRAAATQQRAANERDAAKPSSSSSAGGQLAKCSTANGAGPADPRPAPGNAAAFTSHHSDGLGGIRTFVFNADDDFAEIRDFVADMDQLYRLNIEVLAGDFKAGLTRLVSDAGVKAIFLGTRR